MPVSSEFIDFLLENLASIGPVQARRMFGGAGLYCDGVMFALIADDAVYLKANETTSQAFFNEGLEPFTYHGKAKPVKMSYWRIPERLFDDRDEFVDWAEIALGVARAGAKGRVKTKAKAKTKTKTKTKVKVKPKPKPKPETKKKALARSKPQAKPKRSAKRKGSRAG